MASGGKKRLPGAGGSSVSLDPAVRSVFASKDGRKLLVGTRGGELHEMNTADGSDAGSGGQGGRGGGGGGPLTAGHGKGQVSELWLLLLLLCRRTGDCDSDVYQHSEQREARHVLGVFPRKACLTVVFHRAIYIPTLYSRLWSFPSPRQTDLLGYDVCRTAGVSLLLAPLQLGPSGAFRQQVTKHGPRDTCLASHCTHFSHRPKSSVATFLPRRPCPLRPAVCGKVWGLSAHPTERLYATCGDDGSVRIWSLDDRRVVGSISTDCSCRALCFSPDGKSIAVSELSSDGVIE